MKKNIKILIKKIIKEEFNEGFDIDNNTVSFNPHHKNYVNTSFGKTNNKPYVMKLPYGISYSAYKKTSNNINPIIKAIKNQSENYTITKEGYEKFINRTAIYFAPLIIKEQIDTILPMESSSKLVKDLTNEILKKLPKSYEMFKFDKIILKNPNINAISISNEYNLNDNTKKSLQYTLEKAKKNKYFEIKNIPPKFRKLVKNWLYIENNKLANIIDKNILLIDDYVTTGSTLKEASTILHNAGAKKIIAISIIKL